MQYGSAHGVAKDAIVPNATKAFGLRRYKRMNSPAVVMSMILPWIVFLSVTAMVAFRMHYNIPSILTVILVIIALALGIPCLREVRLRYVEFGREDLTGKHELTWGSFVLWTSFLYFIVAVILGNKIYTEASQPYFDLANLNTYADVNPATVMGAEIMDAGLASFAKGAPPDFKYAMNFKNADTYCVAPITMGDTPLSSYDFWAVGKNCCEESSEGGKRHTAWSCPFANSTRARAGLRAMRDDDRAFFRLAAEQAQKAFNIKATHPLFFYWVEDPTLEAYQYLLRGFRLYMIGMFATFLLQLILVCLASIYFHSPAVTL